MVGRAVREGSQFFGNLFHAMPKATVVKIENYVLSAITCVNGLQLPSIEMNMVNLGKPLTNCSAWRWPYPE